MLENKKEKLIDELRRVREDAIILQADPVKAKEVIDKLLSQSLQMIFEVIRHELLFRAAFIDVNCDFRMHFKRIDLDLFFSNILEFSIIKDVNLGFVYFGNTLNLISKDYDDLYGIDVSQYRYLFDYKYSKFLSNHLLVFKLEDLVKKMSQEGVDMDLVDSNSYKVAMITPNIPTFDEGKEVTYKLVQHKSGNKIVKL